MCVSLWLDFRKLDHLRPLLGLGADDGRKVAGRAAKRRAAQVGEPRFHYVIGEAGTYRPRSNMLA